MWHFDVVLFNTLLVLKTLFLWFLNDLKEIDLKKKKAKYCCKSLILVSKQVSAFKSNCVKRQMLTCTYQFSALKNLCFCCSKSKYCNSLVFFIILDYIYFKLLSTCLGSVEMLLGSVVLFQRA